VEVYINSFRFQERSFYFLFFVDVSKAQEMKKKLHRSMKMEVIGTMAGGVAHDLNNILSGIVSYPELILLQLPKDSKLREPIQAIQQSGKRAAEVVADLLTVARSAAAVREPANLNQLISEYMASPECKQLQQLHPQVSCRKSFDPDLLNINCSPIHIRKCLMNLVINAAEAISVKGEVTITTQNRYIDRPVSAHQFLEKGEYVVLTIQDTGNGIPEEDINHIFEPFYTKKVMGKSGTGLGLTVVWSTIQDHGGTVTVDSGREGTTLAIYLPATREKLPHVLGEEAIEELQGKGERILIIDDEEQQRDIARQMLGTLGYRVDSAESGQAALALLQEKTYALVLLDMIMDPGLSGRETYEQIIAIRPKQRAIIVSGFSENEEVSQTQAMGAGAFVRKPYTLQQIGQAVKEALG
jgi:nitrogen-specific signal transduction histidine kinase